MKCIVVVRGDADIRSLCTASYTHASMACNAHAPLLVHMYEASDAGLHNIIFAHFYFRAILVLREMRENFHTAKYSTFTVFRTSGKTQNFGDIFIKFISHKCKLVWTFLRWTIFENYKK